jgi:hypothetical protein
MSKQVDGIYEIVGEGKKNTCDSLDDKLRDVAVYTIIAMIIIREEKDEMEKQHAADYISKPDPNRFRTADDPDKPVLGKNFY